LLTNAVISSVENIAENMVNSLDQYAHCVEYASRASAASHRLGPVHNSMLSECEDIRAYINELHTLAERELARITICERYLVLFMPFGICHPEGWVDLFEELNRRKGHWDHMMDIQQQILKEEARLVISRNQLIVSVICFVSLNVLYKSPITSVNALPLPIEPSTATVETLLPLHLLLPRPLISSPDDRATASTPALNHDVFAIAAVLSCSSLFRLLSTLSTRAEEVFGVAVLDRVGFDVEVLLASQEAVALLRCRRGSARHERGLAIRALLAGRFEANVEAGEGLLPGDGLQREVNVNKPFRISVRIRSGGLCGLHAQDHRGRDVSGEQTESTCAELLELKSPTRNHGTYVADDCNNIEYCKV
jgi:hypothetical protein